MSFLRTSSLVVVTISYNNTDYTKLSFNQLKVLLPCTPSFCRHSPPLSSESDRAQLEHSLFVSSPKSLRKSLFFPITTTKKKQIYIDIGHEMFMQVHYGGISTTWSLPLMLNVMMHNIYIDAAARSRTGLFVGGFGSPILWIDQKHFSRNEERNGASPNLIMNRISNAFFCVSFLKSWSVNAQTRYIFLYLLAIYKIRHKSVCRSHKIYYYYQTHELKAKPGLDINTMYGINYYYNKKRKITLLTHGLSW